MGHIKSYPLFGNTKRFFVRQFFINFFEGIKILTRKNPPGYLWRQPKIFSISNEIKLEKIPVIIFLEITKIQETEAKLTVELDAQGEIMS